MFKPMTLLISIVNAACDEIIEDIMFELVCCGWQRNEKIGKRENIIEIIKEYYYEFANRELNFDDYRNSCEIQTAIKVSIC